MPGGPGVAAPVDLDTTLYLPATTPAPAVLVAHGFGGSKASVDADARDLADRGFVVLSLVGPRLRHQHRPDRARLPRLRGRRRARARRLAGRAPGGHAGRRQATRGWGSPAGPTAGRFAAARGLRPAGRRARPRDHLERPRPGAVPQRRRRDGPARRHARPRHLRPGRRVQARLGRSVLLGRARPRRRRRGRGRRRAAAAGSPAATGPTAPGRPADGPRPATRPAGTGRPTGSVRPADASRRRSAPPTPRPRPPAASPPPPPTCCAAPRRLTVTDQITAPTLIVQGEQDTLFGLDQADANARQIAAAGGTVKTVWFSGGHDGAPPGPAVREQIGEWFDFHLAGRGDDPGTTFGYAVESGVRARAEHPDQPHRRGTRLPGPRRRPRGRQRGPRAGRPAAGRRQPAGRQPRRDHEPAGARRRAGQPRRAARSVHRRAAGPVRAVPYARPRRPDAGQRRAAGGHHGGAGARPARRRRGRAVREGLRGHARRPAVAPRQRRRTDPGARARRRQPGACDRHAARGGRARRGGQPARRLDQHHRPGIRRHGRARRVADRARGQPGRPRSPCRSCPAGPSRPTPCRPSRRSGSVWCSRWRCWCGVSSGWRPVVARAPTPWPPTTRRARPAAGDPGPRQDLPRRLHRGEGRLVRGGAGHGPRPARAQRRGQDHGAADAHGPHPADGGLDPRVRRAGDAGRPGAGPDRGVRGGPRVPAAPVRRGQPAAVLGRDRQARRGVAPRRGAGDRRARHARSSAASARTATA